MAANHAMPPPTHTQATPTTTTSRWRPTACSPARRRACSTVRARWGPGRGAQARVQHGAPRRQFLTGAPRPAPPCILHIAAAAPHHLTNLNFYLPYKFVLLKQNIRTHPTVSEAHHQIDYVISQALVRGGGCIYVCHLAGRMGGAARRAVVRCARRLSKLPLMSTHVTPPKGPQQARLPGGVLQPAGPHTRELPGADGEGGMGSAATAGRGQLAFLFMHADAAAPPARHTCRFISLQTMPPHRPPQDPSVPFALNAKAAPNAASPPLPPTTKHAHSN